MTKHSTNPWVVLVLVCLAQFMVVLDATVVNVALPSIQADLHMSDDDLQWVVNAYTLVFGGFLLLGGRAGDLIGRKRIFLAGVAIFTGASLLNGLAQSSEWLIISRGIQGLGGALVSPAALSIVNTTFETEVDRTKALGVWSAIAAGGGAVGLIVGGLLTDLLSWPWIFFVNIPIGVATFALSARFVPESKDEKVHKGFDVAGAVTVTAGLIALVYAIVRTNAAGWISAETLGIGGLAVVLLVLFVRVEKHAAEPLIRLDIFKVRTLRTANIVLFLVVSGLYAMFFFNSLYVQRVLGYTPLEAGLAFLPFTAGIVIGAGLAQQLGPRVGLRTSALIGMTIAVAGMFWLLRLEPQGSYVTDLLPSIVPVSVGMGLAFVPLTLIATGGLPAADAGLASGLYNTSQQVGGALGLAVLSTLAANRTDAALADGTSQTHALVDGYVAAFAGAAVLVAVGAVLLFLLLRPRDLETITADQPVTVAG